MSINNIFVITASVVSPKYNACVSDEKYTFSVMYILFKSNKFY